MTLELEILECIAEEVCKPVSELSPETNLFHLDLDSLEFVELMMAIEKRFSIDIPVQEYAQLNTVGDLTAFVEKLVAR